MKKRQLAPFTMLLAIMLIGCKEQSKEAPKKTNAPPVSVKAVQPFKGEITRSVSLPGVILPNQQVTLYAKIPGYLRTITVDKGDQVKQGDLIADIEAPELLADAAKFKADVDVAEIDFKRTTEAQQKAPDLVVLQSVDAAKGKYLAAKATLERANTLLSFTKIIAPFPGTITRRFVDLGAFIPAATSGSAAQNAGAIVTLAEFAIVRAQVAIPEPEVPLVKNGLPVQVLIEELPGRVFAGSITRYSHALADAKTMIAEIDLGNEKGDLLPGMYATMKIEMEKKQANLLVPVEALLVEKANTSVFIVRDNKAKKTPVKIGFNDGKNVEIVNGINNGDEVVLLGNGALSDGQPLNVTEPK